MVQTTAGNPLISEAEAPAETASAAFVGRPRQRARGLAHGLVEDLGEKIRSQSLRPGDKLPTESAIMQAYGVSRTVVREALSKLQAGGLVETLHGVGTFVLQPRAGGVFRLDPGEIAASVDVLAVLELRISLETESAGLAATRRTDEQLVAMRQALDDFEHNVAAAGDTVAPDFRFHLAIAQATGNRYYADLMGQLGLAVIPRTRVSSSWLEVEQRAQHLHKVHQEHQDIHAAIERRDPEAARAAMRLHLVNSRERQRVAHAEQSASDAIGRMSSRRPGMP